MKIIRVKKRSHKSQKPGASQRGAALVTTLLIVALITVTITAMTAKQQHAIQLSQNRQSQLQLKNLISAGEKFAMAVLRRDHADGDRNRSDRPKTFGHKACHRCLLMVQLSKVA